MYSQGVLKTTLREVEIAYDRIDKGILYFYRSDEALSRGIAHMQILRDDGQEIEILDRAAVLQLEPSLVTVGNKISGGIYCPTDETGSCPKFTQGLAAHCIAMGAEFRTGESVISINAVGDQIASIRTEKGLITADAYVMALGNQSPALAKTLGVDLPIYPVKGYSLTIPVDDSPLPPTIGAVDEENLVAISRFGNHMRVTATAEFAGYDKTHKPSDFEFMTRVARELYPNGAKYELAESWAGLRPMTPTNLPIIGRKKHQNLIYDTGHGHIGWTMSHGSGRIVADLISGREPLLSVDSINN